MINTFYSLCNIYLSGIASQHNIIFILCFSTRLEKLQRLSVHVSRCSASGDPIQNTPGFSLTPQHYGTNEFYKFTSGFQVFRTNEKVFGNDQKSTVFKSIISVSAHTETDSCLFFKLNRISLCYDKRNFWCGIIFLSIDQAVLGHEIVYTSLLIHP